MAPSVLAVILIVVCLGVVVICDAIHNSKIGRR